MSSIKRNNRVDTHPGTRDRSKERDSRVVSAPVACAARHGIGPGLAVISGPVVEQEVGRLKRIIIENVWEFIGWGPVDPKTGKPIKERKGEYFHAWIETIKRLGFEPEWRKLNAADYGDATTRQRFILMARSDGRKVSWPMPTHGKIKDAKADLFSDAKPWRPAREIIDWNIKGKSIFGRKKPLSWKSLDRLLAGMLRHKWPNIFVEMIVPEIERSLAYSIRANMRRRHAGKRADRQKVRGSVNAAIRRLRQLRTDPPSCRQGRYVKSAPPKVELARRRARA